MKLESAPNRCLPPAGPGQWTRITRLVPKLLERIRLHFLRLFALETVPGYAPPIFASCPTCPLPPGQYFGPFLERAASAAGPLGTSTAARDPRRRRAAGRHCSICFCCCISTCHHRRRRCCRRRSRQRERTIAGGNRASPPSHRMMIRIIAIEIYGSQVKCESHKFFSPKVSTTESCFVLLGLISGVTGVHNPYSARIQTDSRFTASTEHQP